MDRKAFLDQEPPPGYVAGVGRGATGFTTSADSSRVRFESDYGTEDQDEGILAKKNTTNDDDEADKIYEEVERRLQRRKSVESSEKPSDGVVHIDAGTKVIQSEFTLLKRDLATISVDEWANLPDVGDITRRNKRQRLLDQQMQRTYAAPDVLIAGAGNGFQQSSNSAISQALDTVDVSGVKVSDIEQWEQSNAQVGDIERSRAILASLRRTEPHKPDSWIASARLEEQAKEFTRAKALIAEGCSRVPHNANVWLESIRIHRNSNEGMKKCKAILNEALRSNTTLEELWLMGVELENPADVISRKKILMKALEYLPDNASFWKALVDLEEDDNDKIRLLLKATEMCPDKWDLWLNLINLSTYKEAKAVLNKVRKVLPKERKVWITALKLEEREGSVSVQKLSSMLKKGIAELSKHSAACDVEIWLEESKEAETEGFDKTCEALVENAFSLVPIDENRLLTLISHAENNSGKTSLYIYQKIILEFPHDVGCWVRLFTSLKLGTPDSQLYEFYEQAISLNPETELFYLMFAKDKWILDNDVAAAQKILGDASSLLPHSEKIWMARVKVEVRSKHYKKAFEISKEALDLNKERSPRFWYKHVHLLRFCLHEGMDFVSSGMVVEASNNALEIFSDNFKLYLQRAQILSGLGDTKAARGVLAEGTRKCPTRVELWCALADLDLELGAAARARSLLDTAILRNPESDVIWLKKIDLEINQKDMVTAKQMINKCLKQFPESPRIWLRNLGVILKLSHRKNAYLDALKQTHNSTQILLEIGVFFWIEGKFEKAKPWFDRAVNADSTFGDAWGWLYCFYSKNGLNEEKAKLLQRVEKIADDSNRGDSWTAVVKNPQNLAKSTEQILELVSDKLMQTLA